MPSGFLSEAERERLDGFPAQIVPGDIETYFTLSCADRAQIPRTTSAANRLGFALQLGTLRFLGFCPDDLRATPDAVVTFVAEQLDVAPSELARYGRRGQTRTEHLRQIRRYLRFRKATANDLTIFPHGLTAFSSRGPFRFPFRATNKHIPVLILLISIGGICIPRGVSPIVASTTWLLGLYPILSGSMPALRARAFIRFARR